MIMKDCITSSDKTQNGTKSRAKRSPNKGKDTGSTLGDGLLVDCSGRKDFSRSREKYGTLDVQEPHPSSEAKDCRNHTTKPLAGTQVIPEKKMETGEGQKSLSTS